jgi:molybdenum cofactor cytidylyltransferase
MNVGVILLAAGGSVRMGRPKQLLPFRGKTLLRHAAETVTASGLRPAVVVLGPDHERMAAELTELPIAVAVNPDWERGIGSSIRAGVLAARASDPDALVITLADLPAVTPGLLWELARVHHATGCAVVACRYGDTTGVPALFARERLAELQALPDASGAKRLIEAAGSDVATVDFPGGNADIDTPADFDRLTTS